MEERIPVDITDVTGLLFWIARYNYAEEYLHVLVHQH